MLAAGLRERDTILLMIPLLVLSSCAIPIGVTLFYLFFVRPAKIGVRRERLRSQPFPDDWLKMIERDVPIFLRLPKELQRELMGHIQVFLNEKHFEGCGGLELTDAMRVSIAAQACMLLLNRPMDYYPRLKTILVYPATYVAPPIPEEYGIIPVDDDSMRLGESWGQGIVVLTWSHVKEGARRSRDGLNLVFHEFAHQLDEENGAADGVPLLGRRSLYLEWNRVMNRALQQLRSALERRQRTVLDDYAAASPAEFFAVATETFFENPDPLQRNHPELYDILRSYYRLDPREWMAG